MSNKCVTVLAPNGRRQNVKVTPNTTILQILEEVCAKQGFKPEEYNITHHNKVVDATAPLRFTGLPNNAQLEMAITTRVRSESNVKVGLTFENGERLLGEFEPSATLWRVVDSLCPSEANADPSGVPVVVYMGREVSGQSNLQGTTLRSLGLTRGGAVLRFFKRSHDHVRDQANVSAPLRKAQPIESSHPKKKHVSVLQPAVQATESPCQSESQEGVQSNILLEKSQSIVQPEESQSITQLAEIQSTVKIERVQSEKMSSDIVSQERNDSTTVKSQTTSDSTEIVKTEISEDVKSESLSEMDYEDSSSATCTSSGENAEGATNKTPVTESSSRAQSKGDEEENIIFLDERNAVVFNLSAVSGPVEDVPDDFFDLTVDDARHLHRDIRRRQAELEEEPLLTSQQRELQKSQLLLSQLHQHRRCVVRVQFPDRLVLQGIFRPLDTFKSVMEFVRKFLQYPEAEFELFVTPPKTILAPEQTLVGANCVPCTLLHFGFSSGSYDKYLRDDIAGRITSPRGAAIAARKLRGLADIRPASAPISSSSSCHAAPGPSSARATNTLRTTASSINSGMKTPTDKVPKWFKPGK